MIKATVIEATHSPYRVEQPPIFTLEVTLPRFLLAQFNKHGTIVSNTASSRAIPHGKMRSIMLDSPVVPVFKRHQSGMDANDDLDEATARCAKEIWDKAMIVAHTFHEQLEELGVSKGQANRLLEPFMHVTLIATGQLPAWEHLINLRKAPSAQSEFQEVATAIEDAIYSAYEKQSPYHIPYTDGNPTYDNIVQSVARCARVSYLNHGKDTTIEDDRKLFDRLIDGGHMSPFEHVVAYRELYSPEYGQAGRMVGLGSTMICNLRWVLENDLSVDSFLGLCKA